MAMRAECPRCPTEVTEEAGQWSCPMHGPTPALWRPEEPSYDMLVEHLETAGGLPSWVPWPLPPGWVVLDFGAVRSATAAVATVVSCGGMTETDGPVTMTVVTEEPGVGLGARVAGVVHDDPGAHTQGRPVQTWIRAGGASVALWLLSTTAEGAAGPAQEDPWDRAVLVGEAQGRWLWLTVTPASAALGLDGWGDLVDLGGRGPELVDLPFGEPRAGGW